MKKFLIINPFGIGDVLFTTPIIAGIRSNYPDSVIGYWCNERVKDIFKGDPNINKIFALSRGDLKRIYNESKLEGIKKFLNLLSSIKKERFDVSLDYSLDHRYGLISKLSGIKRRIGFNYKNRGRFLTDKIEIDGYEGKHVVEYYSGLLKFINIEPKAKNLFLFIPEGNKLKSKNILKRAGISEGDLIIGVAPGAGASWGKSAHQKHWSAIRYAQLADRIIKDLKVKILILGDDSERPIADIIVNAMKNKPIDLIGITSLEELIAIINNLNILITNDGGLLHIAVALSVKTVSIFGPVDEVVYGPYPPSDKHIVIKKELICRPCYQKFRMPICDRDKECINSISVEEVFDATQRLISTRTS